MLPATTECTCWTSQLPKVVPGWCALYILTSCFAPQGRALFEHLKFQNCSEHEVFLTFFDIFASKCASRIFAPQLRAISINFSSLISPDGLRFDPPEPQNFAKHSFSHFLFSFFSDSFSSLIFFLLLFSSLNLPTSVFSSILSEV